MNFSVVPQPNWFQILSNKPCFELTRLSEIEAGKGTDKSKKELLTFVCDYFEEELLGTGKEKICLEIVSDTQEKEGYSLTVKKDRVTVIGNDEAGLFYGIQTLKQLLIQGDFKLPETEIHDSPSFPVRGFMLDCGRYYFPLEDIKSFIDIMALHKFNEFHWHLSEDQGFRCQLENQLLLTEIGSYRSHTNFNTTAHQGYYTKKEMKEIVDYAHERYIKVVPEIDTPGHVVSMIAAYPFLSCFDREMTVATSWGIKHDVLCVGKESTFEFMYSVFDELTEIFTDGVIHIGGDEVPTTRWKICPHCRKRIKDEGLKDESDLHTYYLQRIASYLQDKGVEVRMWNDRKKEKMVDTSVAWQLWNGDMKDSEVSEEINKGRKFIISDANHYYLDLPYGQVPLKATYEYTPVFDGVKDECKNNIIGVEACLWTEFVPDMKKAIFCTFPRLGAISETAWTKKENRNYDRFHENLKGYYKVLNCHGVEPVQENVYNPKTIRKLASRIYWARRRLCWAGLHNLIDNYSVKRKFGK